MRRSRIRHRKPMRPSPGTVFSYKRPEELSNYVAENGSILPRTTTNLSQKQQKRLARAIKRARHLSLLPFTQTL